MAARSFLSAYVLVGVIHVVGVVSSNSDAATLTKPLLMPLLLAWLVAEGRRLWCRTYTMLAVGISFAWVGDLLLMADSDLAFMLGVAAFGVTQLLYTGAFHAVPGVRYRRDIVILSQPDPPGLVRQHPWLIAIFVGYYVSLMALVLPTAGWLGLAIALYGVVISIMAVGALNLVQRMPAIAAWLTFAGALTFVASDSLIALTSFGPLSSGPTLAGVVMATYIVGQALIVVSVVAGSRDNREVLRPDVIGLAAAG